MQETGLSARQPKESELDQLQLGMKTSHSNQQLNRQEQNLGDNLFDQPVPNTSMSSAMSHLERGKTSMNVSNMDVRSE